MQQKTIPRLPRRLLAAMLAGVCLGLTGAPVLAQTESAAAMMQRESSPALAAAQRDLAAFAAHQMQVHAGTAPVDFPLDITDVQDLKNATISYGFPVYTIAPKELLNGRGELKTMAKPTGQWRFVISLEGRPIGMATVESNRGRFETVAYGAAVLAKDTDAVMAYHGNAARSNMRFLRIYQARSDFLEVTGQDGQARFAPLHSARESLMLQHRAIKNGATMDSKTLGNKPADNSLMDAADLLQPLRAAVKTNMEEFR